MKSNKFTARWIRLFILTLSVTFFILGLSFPILSTKSKILGVGLDYREIRLFDSVELFYSEREYILAFIILFFTFIFPGLKFLDLINRELNIFNYSNLIIKKVLKYLDKWSMLDVFVVALLVLNFKMDSTIIVMKIKIGTTFLALSILLRLVATSVFLNNSKNAITL